MPGSPLPSSIVSFCFLTADIVACFANFTASRIPAAGAIDLSKDIAERRSRSGDFDSSESESSPAAQGVRGQGVLPVRTAAGRRSLPKGGMITRAEWGVYIWSDAYRPRCADRWNAKTAASPTKGSPAGQPRTRITAPCGGGWQDRSKGCRSSRWVALTAVFDLLLNFSERACRRSLRTPGSSFSFSRSASSSTTFRFASAICSCTCSSAAVLWANSSKVLRDAIVWLRLSCRVNLPGVIFAGFSKEAGRSAAEGPSLGDIAGTSPNVSGSGRSGMLSGGWTDAYRLAPKGRRPRIT